MENFVTLFDSLFLPQGLALHMSMERHIRDYTLWILCVDDEVHDSLTKLNLPNVRLLKLSELETPELLAVKPTRSKGEYCWTLTPFAPRFVFETDARISRVTYLDADLWFRKNPAPIFKEFIESGKHVLITDHAYAPEHDQSVNSGQFCVQFITFSRITGEYIRQWWEERCIEWCFAVAVNGKFGDQKYLDSWPELFPESIHVLNNKELILAPWNATRFPFGNAVCWHFHGLRIIVKSSENIFIEFGSFLLPKVTHDYVYLYYLKDLRYAILMMCRLKIVLISQKKLSALLGIKLRLRMLINRFWVFNTRFGSYLD